MSIADLVTAARFTILIGKNGAGKSTLLRGLTQGHSPNIKYISPERGGTLKYDSNVDNNMSQNESWLKDSRQTNRFEQFREQSAAQFRSLETTILREIEQIPERRADQGYTFSAILEQINALLPAIKMVRRDGAGFSIQTKQGEMLDETKISSGESELIALAIEVLAFSRNSSENKILLLDEPDVHLHPDLQQRFIKFVESVATAQDLRVVIATHSTAIIGAFSGDADLQIIPITRRDQNEFHKFGRSAVCEEILPIFGAHPLSTAFNRSPVVLVEGDDDRRIVEQVVRSSRGKVSLAPCVVGSVNDFGKWEDWLSRFLPVLYDEPRAFSLRDLDDAESPELNDIDFVKRIRLNCYAMENLLLANDILSGHGFDATSFKQALQDRINRIPEHKYTNELRLLVDNFDSRRTAKIKDLRNIIMAELGSNKPWEVLVGQAIAETTKVDAPDDHSIQIYLGEKAADLLLS